ENGAVPSLMISGEGENDQINIAGIECRDCLSGTALEGGPGNDTLVGGNGTDMVAGDDGKDVIYGEGGNDVIWGNAVYPDSPPVGRDDDKLFGGAGQDIALGQYDNDLIFGGDDNDDLDMNSIYDESFGLPIGGLDGGPGNDAVIGGGGADIMRGGDGRDSLFSDEFDSGEPTQLDVEVDCGSNDSSDPQYFRASAGDPFVDCDEQMNSPLSLESLVHDDPEQPWWWFG
ncbi:MAG: calcium-binding protein, partial [Vicinamibacterales bacterium]